MGMAWRNWFSGGNQKIKFSCVANLFAGQTSVWWKSFVGGGRYPPWWEVPIDSTKGVSRKLAVLTASETEGDGGRLGQKEENILGPSQGYLGVSQGTGGWSIWAVLFYIVPTPNILSLPFPPPTLPHLKLLSVNCALAWSFAWQAITNSLGSQC